MTNTSINRHMDRNHGMSKQHMGIINIDRREISNRHETEMTQNPLSINKISASLVLMVP